MSKRRKWLSSIAQVKKMGKLIDVENNIKTNAFEGVSIFHSFNTVVITAENIQITVVFNVAIIMTVFRGVNRNDLVEMFNVMKTLGLDQVFIPVIAAFIRDGLFSKINYKLTVTQNIESIKSNFIETCWSKGIFPDLKVGHQIRDTFKCNGCDADHPYPLVLTVNEWSIGLGVETDTDIKKNKQRVAYLSLESLVKFSQYFKDGSYVEFLGALVENYMEIVEIKYQVKLTKK